MSSSDATKGQAALAASDYPTAIKHLTLALTNQPSNPSPAWLTQRSIAYQRTGEYALALADADNALLAAIKRGKRELIATAHFRRAVALHGLGRFGDARLCLNWCGKLNEKEKGFTIWMAKLKGDYEAAGGDDAECNSISVKEIPDPVEDVHKVVVLEPKQIIKGKGKEKQSVGIAPKPLAAAPTTTPTPKEKIRTEWYQSPSTVTIEVFAKGIPKDNIEVKIEKESLEVSFPIAASHSTYDYTVSPFFSPIDASKSSFRITPHKLEIVLQKLVPGSKWSSLEGAEQTPVTEHVTDGPAPTSTLPAGVIDSKKDKIPSYPTSSRTGPKNWDTVVPEDEDEDNEEAGVDSFFKTLYKNADPDTKRAMMKSYQESNGTSLSTVWSEVGSKKVETHAPDGMVAKKWGE